MICPKCKRKYEDDMPKCLWCDAPNPNYGTEDAPEPEPTSTPEPKKIPVEAKPIEKSAEKPVEKPVEKNIAKPVEKKHAKKSKEPQAKKTGSISGRESGTQVFWLAFFGGFLGAHCFKAHRYRRGLLYLIFGGAVYRAIFKILMQKGIVCPLPLAAFFLAATLVVGILYTFDIWKIALEKFRNHKTHHRYRAKSWMKPMACIAVCIYAFMAYITVDFIKENIVKRGHGIASVISLEMEAYTIAQENYFNNTGKIGNFSEIQYKFQNMKWMKFYSLTEEDKALRVTYLNNLNCSKGASWLVKPSIVDTSLVWSVTLPDDMRCNAMAPLIQKLKNRLEKPLQPATSTPKLDEGVNGVGVVPDTTQHGDSL